MRSNARMGFVLTVHANVSLIIGLESYVSPQAVFTRLPIGGCEGNGAEHLVRLCHLNTWVNWGCKRSLFRRQLRGTDQTVLLSD